MNGSATTVFPGLLINNNNIGNVHGRVRRSGDIHWYYGQGSLTAYVSGNTVYVEGYVPSSSATHGINVGVNSTAVTGATIEKNKVSRVRNNNGQNLVRIRN